MDGPVCVIGAGGESEDANGQHFVSGAGAAYVYELQSDDKWKPIEKLVGTWRGIGDLLGEDAVDVSGSQVVAGAWLADTLDGNAIIDGGAVYVYERDSPITAVTELPLKRGILVFNNPSADGLLKVHQPSVTMEPLTLRLFSLDGVLVFQSGQIEGQDFEADLSLLPPGIYFVQINRRSYFPEILKWIKL